MSNVTAESGLQFLTRIQNANNLKNIDTTLFPEGLKKNDVVELTAESTYLKNVFIMYLMRKVTVPDTFNGKEVGGLNTGILLIDTAFQFEIKQFAAQVQNYVDNLTAIHFSPAIKQEIMERSLGNLTYLACFDSQQLLASFHHLHVTISSNPKIKLVILDNVGANYWQDSVNGGLRRMDLYEKKLISTLKSCLKDFKLPVLYVRPDFFVLKNQSGCNVSNYRIHIRVKDVGSQVFEVAVTFGEKAINKLFVVASDSEGLRWL